MSNDDARLRQLAERLVAMSPEPPPYPEDVPLTSPRTEVRRLSPALVFTGAAALVIIVAAIPFLLFGGGPSSSPVGTVPPDVVGTTSPTITTIPSTSPTTSDSGPVQMEIRDTVIFLVTDPAESFSGNPSLVPFYTTVTMGENADEEQVSLATLQLLGNPDETADPPAGFYNAVPAGVEFYEATLLNDGSDQILQVEVSANFADGAGGLLADVTMLNEIVYTATWSSPDTKIVFTINGEPIQAFGTEGLIIGEGVGRGDFLDHLSPIVITEPFVLGSDDLPAVAGIANVYEATVSMRVVWAESGEVVYEDFTTATCGTGCWGEFGFSVDVPELEPGQLVQVFWNSAEDGRMLDVVTYSVGPVGPWQFFSNPNS